MQLKEIQGLRKRISIKWIKGQPYVYTWEYIIKTLRSDQKKRFKWTYLGPLKSYPKLLTKEEQCLVSMRQLFEKKKEEARERRYHEIVKQLTTRSAQDSLFIPTEETHKIAFSDSNYFVKEMFKQLDYVTFYEFVSSGGDFGSLYHNTKEKLD